MRGITTLDTFNRTSTASWGTNDTGQTYSLAGFGGTIANSDFNVAPGGGTLSVPVTSGYRMAYNDTITTADADAMATFAIPVQPTGGPLEPGNIMLRGTGSPPSQSYYLFRIRANVDRSYSMQIFDRNGNQLGDSPTVLDASGNSLVLGDGNHFNMRAQAIGRWLRLKAWHISDPEPLIWSLSVVDPDPNAYIGPGWAGVRGGVASGNTNTLPVVFNCTHFEVNPVNNWPFDNDPMPVKVLWAPGADLSADYRTWPWQDMTPDVRASDSFDVSITVGRPDESGRAAPAQATWEVLNDSGAYGTGPLGPNWPNVKRNTPVWHMIEPATRFFGFITGFPPYWDETGQHAYVKMTANGKLRQVQQGKSPIDSPAYLGILKTNPLVYMPMEDSQDSSQIVSGLPGDPPMPLIGTWNLAANSDLVGSKPLAVMTDSSAFSYHIRHQIFPNNAWSADWHMLLPSSTLPNPTPEFRLMVVYTFGAVANWQVVVGNDGFEYMAIHGFNSAGVKIVDSGHFIWGGPMHGGWCHFHLTARQNGSGTDYKIAMFPSLGGSGSVIGPTNVAVTYGNATFMYIPADPGLNGVGLGHVCMYNVFDFLQPGLPLFGYPGEFVTTRLARLCDANNLPLDIRGTSNIAMGPQTTNTLPNALQECEQTDLGMIADGFGPGLTYFARSVHESIGPALVLDMAQNQIDEPFEPADDDQLNRNQFTVSNVGANSGPTYSDDTGPLGTEAIGTYDSSVTVNVQNVGLLMNFASWLVHEGTQDGLRYPNLNLDLRARPELIAGWEAVQLMNRIDALNVSNVATNHPPATVHMLLEGYTETYNQDDWKVAANTTPYDPWLVGKLAQDSGDTSEFMIRLDTDGTGVTHPVSQGASAIQVTTFSIDSPLWTLKSDDYPVDLNIDGIQVRVNSVTPVIEDTFTRSVIGGFGNADTGQPWTVATLGDSTSRYSVNGGSNQANFSVTDTNSLSATIDAGVTDIDYSVDFGIFIGTANGGNVSQWVGGRVTDFNNMYAARLDLQTDGSLILLLLKNVAGTTTGLASGYVVLTSGHTSGEMWTVRLAAVGSDIRCKAWKAGTVEPGWQLMATDTSLTTGTKLLIGPWAQPSNTNTKPFPVAADNLVINNPQQANVDGTTVIKALPAGSPVSLWRPTVLGL